MNWTASLLREQLRKERLFYQSKLAQLTNYPEQAKVEQLEQD
jgi:hypothetical protein